jgi:predicted metalloprotease with PDZ domain
MNCPSTPRKQITTLLVLMTFLMATIPALMVVAADAQPVTVEERARSPLSLQYTTSISGNDFDRFRIAIEVHHRAEATTRFVLPRWAPGAYRIVNWHEGIGDVAAGGVEGSQLEVSRLGDSIWEVSNGVVSDFVFSYTVRAGVERGPDGVPRLNNRHYLYDQGGLIDGPRSWMYVEGQKDVRVVAHFDLPANWIVATGLNPTPDPHVFSAEDYDWLIDCPTLMGSEGNIHLWRFKSWGVPFTIAYDAAGQPVRFDHAAFTASVKRICDYQASIFGGFPFPHYTFIYDNGGGGGLEHLRSTTIGGAAERLETSPDALWNITAHEFFHTWNVKRIRPYALGPFDYQQPNRTQSLWLAEGVTDTYTAFTGIRAGYFKPEEFYEGLARSISSWMGSPAQPHAAPARMSWTTGWDPRDRNPYGTISYYTQGEVIGTLLDLIIREATQNVRSLDDVMRILMWEHGGEFLERPGFSAEDVMRICSEVAGKDLYDFFEDHVLGTVKPDWAEYFSYAGLQYRESLVELPDVGFFASNIEEGALVRRVTRGGAASRAGLRINDRIVSINGAAVANAGQAARAVQSAGIGGDVGMVVLRGGQEQRVTWKLEARTILEIEILENPEATPAQRAVREGFLTGKTG